MTSAIVLGAAAMAAACGSGSSDADFFKFKIGEKVSGFVVKSVTDLPEVGGRLVRMEYEKNEKQYIRLLDGKNACPPNDVGGISGYKEMLNVIKEDPDSDEAWEYYMWLGSKWDEKFFPAIDTAISLNELNHL